MRGVRETSSDQSVRIAGICGSLRAGSCTRMALSIALAGAVELGAEPDLIDLRDYALPFCSGVVEDPSYPNDVTHFRDRVMQANGIILATPNYHGTFSGVLKNALDLLTAEHFKGKMIGLIGVSGGRMGGANTLNSLRAIGRTVNAWVIPFEAWVFDAATAFEQDGTLKNREYDERVREVGRQVTRLTRMLASREARELLHLWEQA